MNTLSDTDKPKARPSVWPVYAIAAPIGLMGLLLGLMVFSPVQGTPIESLMAAAMLGAPGLFAIATAYGLLMLRPWGRWFAVVWTGVFTAGCVALGVYLLMAAENADIKDAEPEATFLRLFGQVSLIMVIPFVWVLATRRQLFFPPKQEGEE